MANKYENLSRAVGQPHMDRPYGGRPTPEINAPKKSNSGKNILAIGGVGALVAAGAFAASQFGKNEATSPNSEPTPPQGAIVEPSTSLPASPLASIELPTASPVATAEATPTPKPEATPVPISTPDAAATAEITAEPGPTVNQIAEQIINQDEEDIKKTSIKNVRAGVDSIWEKYGEQLSEVNWKDSPTGKLSKDYLINKTNLLEKGYSGNASGKELALERLIISNGFIVTYLVAYDQIEDADTKAALAKESDRIYDYAVTSIDPKNAEKSRAQLEQDITGSLKLHF